MGALTDIGWGVGCLACSSRFFEHHRSALETPARGGSLRGRAPSQETSCRRRLRRLSHPEGCSQPAWACGRRVLKQQVDLLGRAAVFVESPRGGPAHKAGKLRADLGGWSGYRGSGSVHMFRGRGGKDKRGCGIEQRTCVQSHIAGVPPPERTSKCHHVAEHVRHERCIRLRRSWWR